VLTPEAHNVALEPLHTVIKEGLTEMLAVTETVTHFEAGEIHPLLFVPDT
jgi:hypothetical protein